VRRWTPLPQRLRGNVRARAPTGWSGGGGRRRRRPAGACGVPESI